MNKVSMFLFFLIQISTSLCAQINWADYSQSFPKGTLEKPEMVALILAIPKTNNSFWNVRDKSSYFDALARDSSFSLLRPAGTLARTTFDTARAQFFLHGVNKVNAGSYQFRVLEYPGQKVVESWKSVTSFTDSSLIKSSGLPQMAYLGGYSAPLGRMLILDVRTKRDEKIIATCMVSRESVLPVVSSIYTSEDLDFFLQKLQYPWAKQTAANAKQYALNNLKLPVTNTNLIFLLNADIYSKSQIQYQLIRDGRVARKWQDNEYDNSFIWLKDYAPGQYRIQIRYAVQPQHVTEYQFEIEPEWYQSLWFKFAVAGMGALIISLIVFVYMLIHQRRKTRTEAANKDKLQLELKALYAQLNPHFVFNALSSIQGLINRHDIRGANEYLSDFAGLMRESLTNSGKEENSLRRELATIGTYLKLEQLRFGFQYEIQVDEQIDVSATNLPSLLWQPLLENAVKHGVAPLQDTGRIGIIFERKDGDLIVKIDDNGKGIGTKINESGFGLKLTRDRLHILNELNREQPISLAFNERLPSGTEAILTFTHWFL